MYVLSDTLGNLTVEVSLLHPFLGDLTRSEVCLCTLPCPPALSAFSDPLSSQRSKIQRTSAFSVLQRKEMVSTAILHSDTKT